MKENKIPVYGDTEIIPIESLEKILDPEDTGISTFYIYDAYSEELRETREKRKQADHNIKLEKKRIKETIKGELGLDLRPDGSLGIPKDDKVLLEKLENSPYLSYISETYMNVKFGIK